MASPMAAAQLPASPVVSRTLALEGHARAASTCLLHRGTRRATAGRLTVPAVGTALSFSLVVTAAARTRRQRIHRRHRRPSARQGRTASVRCVLTTETEAPATGATAAALSGEGRGPPWLRPLQRVARFLKGGLLVRLLAWRRPKLLPVTVLSGFLGSGKTTLLKHILRLAAAGEGGQADHPLRVAVIVNDMGEINIDASEIKNSRLIQEKATMVELQNGCICCTLRGDLLKTVRELSEERAYDYLVIESTGISEPLPVAQTFTLDVDDMVADMVVVEDEEEAAAALAEAEAAAGTPEGAELEAAPFTPEEVRSLSRFARLDTMVTVVDALNVYDVLGSLETLAGDNITNMLGNNGEGEDEKDERGIAQLMLDQIEFANVILLSKVDLVKREGTIEEIRALLKKLNPSAKIIVPQPHFADLPLSSVINTHLFNMEEAEESAGWQLELAKHGEGGEGHTPETEEYGISSVVFNNSERPFHPARLDAVLCGFRNHNHTASSGVFSGVVRAKGQLWMATAHSFPVELHLAGRHVQLQVNEPFVATIPPCCRNDSSREVQEGLAAVGAWHPEFGDRCSTVVFMGVGLDKEGILSKLDSALLTEAEMSAGVASWSAFEDKFFGTEYFEAKEDFEPKTIVLTD